MRSTSSCKIKGKEYYQELLKSDRRIIFKPYRSNSLSDCCNILHLLHYLFLRHMHKPKSLNGSNQEHLQAMEIKIWENVAISSYHAITL
jgi:hypothetical protein